MLNLDEGKIPEYSFILNETEHIFDPLELAFAAESLIGEKNPRVICEALEKVTELKFTTFQAIKLLQDVLTFVEEHAGEVLKNSTSQSPSSTTITDLPQKNSDDSPQEPTLDS